MIDNMGDWKSTWTGKSAKWIDECKPSTNQPIVTLFENDFSQAITDTALIGGTT